MAEISEQPGDIRIVAKASYKNKTYYVRWHGLTKTGKYMARLITLDGKMCFWVNCMEPGGIRETTDKPTAYIVTSYEHTTNAGSGHFKKYKTLADMQAVAEKYARGDIAPRGRCSECDVYGPKGQHCTECHEGFYI